MTERRSVKAIQIRVAKRVLLKRGCDIVEENGCFNVIFPQNRSFKLHQTHGGSGLVELALQVLRAERATGMHF